MMKQMQNQQEQEVQISLIEQTQSPNTPNRPISRKNSGNDSGKTPERSSSSRLKDDTVHFFKDQESTKREDAQIQESRIQNNGLAKIQKKLESKIEGIQLQLISSIDKLQHQFSGVTKKQDEYGEAKRVVEQAHEIIKHMQN